MDRRMLVQQWLGWSGFIVSTSFILTLTLSTPH
jgi:hypothetical protein